MEATKYQHIINFCRVFYLGPTMGKDHKNMIQTSNAAISLAQRSVPLLYLLFKTSWFIAPSEAGKLLNVLRLQPASVTPKISREQYHWLYCESWRASTGLRTMRVSQTTLGSRGLRRCTAATALLTCTQYYWSTSYFPPCTRSMKSLLCQAPNLSEVVCTPSMFPDCSETIRRQMLEKHYCFSNIWNRLSCFSTVKEEKIQGKYTENKNML